MKKVRFVLLAVACCLFAVPGALLAQSASTGAIVGTVRDPSGAVVPGAEVELSSTATGLRRVMQTGTDGTYAIANVPPGDYEISVTAAGFRKSVLPVNVSVTKSVLADFSLQLGEATQTVEVSATAAVELQTINSSVGDVIQQREIQSLPTSQRQVSELVYLQPATTPLVGGGEGAQGGGSVAGGRVDQNSATLDGIIITDQAEGGYLATGGTIAQFPMPVDAIEEFRGAITNPGETMSRSGGGQFAFATRRGTNQWHGSAYEYHQNGALDANSWTRNRLGQNKPRIIDNRFGGSIGGPLWRDKTFAFFSYEGRRFPASQDAERNGISESFRQGILRFRDGTGAVRSYNLNPANGPLAANCGSSGNQPCDPRGIGMSPIIKKFFNFYPVANDPSSGDGLNTMGILQAVATPTSSDFWLLRLDHNITDKWHAFGYYMYQRHQAGDTIQVDFNPAVTNGNLLVSTSGSPQHPRLATFGLTGLLTPNLTYEFRFGYNKQGFRFARELPPNLLPEAGIGALQFAPSLLDSPGDPPPVRSRPEGSSDTFHQFNNSLSWVKGSHFFSAGVMYQHINLFHNRVDKIPAHAVPIAQITSNNFLTLPSSVRPPTCSGSVQTNCLRSGDVGAWNQLYAGLLGMWDNTQSFHVRDAAGNAVSGFQSLESTQTSEHLEFHASDVWRIGSSLTFNYGLNVQYETPYRDVDGKDFLLIDANSGELIRPKQLLKQKLEAAGKGQVFNPSIAYVHPEQVNGRAMYPPVFNVGPRVGLAWNPSFSSGILGKLMGDRKTVLRGGYSLVHDQILGIQTQLWGMIGNQLIGDSASVIAPTCDAAGTPGPGCVPGSSPFRVGIDGKVFIPPAGPLAIPNIPQSRNTLTGVPFGIPSGVGFDPDFSPGDIHGVTFTLQRQLPAESLVEVGWIGRWGRDLANSSDVIAPPVNYLKDMTGKSSQTFAQAFDAVAQQLRAGTSPAQVTPQPWFENLFGAGGTATVATKGSSALVGNNVGTLLQNTIDPMLQASGKPTTQSQQFGRLRLQSSGSWMNYQGLFTTLRKRTTRGLSVVVNYTWSHCLDLWGLQGDSLNGQLADPYNPAIGYGSCPGDIRHIFQGYGLYNLPSPVTDGVLGKVLGGWHTSYIFTASSGRPLLVNTGSPFSVGGSLSAVVNGPVPKVGINSGVSGSGGVGTSGDPSKGGTGLNLFADPEAVFKSLSPLYTSQGTHSNRGTLNTLGQWNLDMSVGKETRITERVNTKFTVDFFNIFNHVNFLTPSLSLFSPASFGVITRDQSAVFGNNGVGPRRIQASLRFEF